MGTSQRASRGFHRLGLLLAAFPLLFCTVFSTTAFTALAGPAYFFCTVNCGLLNTS